jgi:3D (Asp-Asp-Asp) domain-containing protein
LTYAERRNLAWAILAAFIAVILLSGCGTSQHALPPYEPPLAKTDFQHVRTTAYTHTESDHRAYSNHNALGGELHAAGPPIHRAEVTRRAIPVGDAPRAMPVDETASYSPRSYSPRLQPFSVEKTRTVTRTTKRGAKTTRSVKRAVVVSKPRIGSAAADWSRWPVGTTFRLLSTSQIYRIEDYGWALAGRNTIDLYMPNQREMNSWGARQEAIQILQWRDSQESLQFLRRHQDYRHIKRMVLELEGRHEEAAALR